MVLVTSSSWLCSSAEPLFESPRLDDELRLLIKQTFPEFYQPGAHWLKLIHEFNRTYLAVMIRRPYLEYWGGALNLVFCWPLLYGLCNTYLCVEPRPAAEPMPIAEPHPLLQPHPPVGTQPTLKTVGADEGVGTVDDPMIIASDEELQGEDEEVTSAFSGNARNKVSWWIYVQHGRTCAYSIWMSKQHRCTYSVDI